MNNELPLPVASGEGAEFFDDRALFYLEHRDRIETWGGLRWDAYKAAHRFLESLSEQVWGMSDDWITWSGAIGKWTCLMLLPPGSKLREVPSTGLGLGWIPNGVMPEAERTAPFVGIYLDPESEISSATAASLADLDGGNQRGYSSSESWPRFRYLPAGSRWWTDLDAYRKTLLEEVHRLKETYGDLLERATAGG